ncbi:TetR/AcrR family transcriptional regulator [Brevundimonas sp.]|uniref:TetR/AcrR family transcriptional regulator n=1 Tax=Brevundimonas sp. TaxID=1871086 RepID=UPI00289DA8CF|nr:TetR/AcrR family transcriptional regulator [Brevundimonas sp.]
MTVVPLEPVRAPLVFTNDVVETHDADGAPRKRRDIAKDVTRLRVLAAARFLFTHVGFFDTGIRDIAQRIGMSTGAVFAQVKDKEELWRAAMNGPSPSLPLAEEVALVLALRPGWRWLIRFDGSRYLTTLTSPDYNPMQNGGLIFSGQGDSPAAALREVRIAADRQTGEGFH